MWSYVSTRMEYTLYVGIHEWGVCICVETNLCMQNTNDATPDFTVLVHETLYIVGVYTP